MGEDIPYQEAEDETTKVAIVGSAQDKFNADTEAKARLQIRSLLLGYKAKYKDTLTVISGGCHLGGIDAYAEEIAKELGINTLIFKPDVLQWDPKNKYGYRKRNIDIAETCDILYVIVPAVYPKEYLGYRFNNCYHCDGATDHIKSGGCWTYNKAERLRKEVHRIIL